MKRTFSPHPFYFLEIRNERRICCSEFIFDLLRGQLFFESMFDSGERRNLHGYIFCVDSYIRSTSLRACFRACFSRSE